MLSVALFADKAVTGPLGGTFLFQMMMGEDDPFSGLLMMYPQPGLLNDCVPNEVALPSVFR